MKQLEKRCTNKRIVIVREKNKKVNEVNPRENINKTPKSFQA